MVTITEEILNRKLVQRKTFLCNALCSWQKNSFKQVLKTNDVIVKCVISFRRDMVEVRGKVSAKNFPENAGQWVT